MVIHLDKFYLISTMKLCKPFWQLARLGGVDHLFKLLIRVWAFVVIWSLQPCTNDMIFNNKDSYLMQVIYWCKATLHSWSPLIMSGASWPIYRGVYTIGGHGKWISPNIEGCVIYGLTLHIHWHLSNLWIFFVFDFSFLSFLTLCCGCVHCCCAEPACVMLKLFK
jgi:hypothetical protein